MQPQTAAAHVNDSESGFSPDSTSVRRAVVAVTCEEIQAYMPLVHQVVARTLRRLPPNVLRDDLVAAGTYGLMDALRKQPRDQRGPDFEWYARTRIRGAIFDELRNLDWLSRGARAEVNAAVESEHDRRTSGTIVIGFDDLPEARRNVAATDDESPLDLAERNSERIALSRAVDRLPEREAQIVNLHYFQGVPFKQIAAMLGVSEPRISQLHARAMKLMRAILEEGEDATTALSA